MNLSGLSLFVQEVNMKTFLYTLLLVSLATEWLHAQHIEDCAFDYNALKKSVYLEPEHVRADKAIYLSATYIQKLRDRSYHAQASGLIYYEYVRPASKKELKTKEIENPNREQIGSDGNIYVPKASSGHYHFFKPSKIFKGKFNPRWGDPNLIVPMGLRPFDVLPYADKKFWVVERKTDYIVLEVEKQKLVYFIDYPKMEEVFETEEIRQQLTNKSEEAGRLLGRNWFIKNESLPQFRSEADLTAPQDLFNFAPLIELKFTSSKVNQLQAVLFSEKDSITINERSRFKILDKKCVLGQQQTYTQLLRENFDEENARLLKILRSKSQDDWSKDPWVKQTLFKRFWLLPSKREKSSYQYVLLNKEEFLPKSFLYATTDIEGNLSLRSHFASEEGLYHNRILFYRGYRRDSIESSRISTRDRQSIRSYTKDYIVEEIDFTSNRDLNILKKIAFSTNRRIRIRFKAGGKYYSDTILEDFHKQQIRDVYMLAQILKNTPFAQGQSKD